MEMLLAWGISPQAYEALGWHTRKRMWRFWLWKHEREDLLQKEREMEAGQRRR